jgi:hypothetical protein
MNFKTLLKGLASAAIGGAATTVTQILTTQSTPQLKQIGIGAGMGALVTTLAYLTKSPLAGTTMPPKE